MRQTSTLRLILGDQLNPEHSWFRHRHDDVVYVMMEVRQETDYVLHHAQKIIAIFAGMRELARQLRAQGHRVHYLKIGDARNRQSLPANLDDAIEQFGAAEFEYQMPDEWRLDEQLARYARNLSIPSRMVDSEHFYTRNDEAGQLFEGRKQWLMEHFYRAMRARHGVPNAAHFAWPLNRQEALRQLDGFIAHALPHFGEFQDAMSSKAWRLFHSLLSFALNAKMLNPREVVDAVQQAWRGGRAPLASAEGYIRQVLGWREYVRGVYWSRMPAYAQSNVFGHALPLPRWFWDGRTGMRCLAGAIGDSLQHAHAHHSHRLMVIGNFALLAGLDPQQVHEWYLGVYIDAFEWVEMPNTLGMSQFADGGMLATKPYVSSAAYIDRMSDYCKGCRYDRKARIGGNACPFNALYWDFFARNEARLASNPRIGMVYPQLRKMAPADVQALRAQADAVRGRLDEL